MMSLVAEEETSLGNLPTTGATMTSSAETRWCSPAGAQIVVTLCNYSIARLGLEPLTFEWIPLRSKPLRK